MTVTPITGSGALQQFDTNAVGVESRFATIVNSATKAAVSMLTVQYAKAVPEINFDAVEPGLTATDFIHSHRSRTDSR